MEEKRKSPRLLTWNLAYIKKNFGLLETTLPAEPARMLNISERGCLVEKDGHNFKKGDSIEVHLILNSIHVLKGVVKWTSDEYIGVSFEHPHPEVVKAAKQFRNSAIAGWKE